MSLFSRSFSQILLPVSSCTYDTYLEVYQAEARSEPACCSAEIHPRCTSAPLGPLGPLAAGCPVAL